MVTGFGDWFAARGVVEVAVAARLGKWISPVFPASSVEDKGIERWE
jgi:hypothetical protein